MSLKMPETRHFGCVGHFGSIGCSIFRAGKFDLASRENSYAILLEKSTLGYINFKVVQFEFPAFFIQVENPDLHPKKPELCLEFLEFYFENLNYFP